MIFKKGVYYVGDLCYVVEDWLELLEQSSYFNSRTTRHWFGCYKGQPAFAGSTRYGDGLYFDSEGRQYPVDSGSIGIVPVEVLGADADFSGGQVVTFSEDFEVSWQDGDFVFGHVSLPTGDNHDDEYCDEDGWDDDDY